MRTFTLSAAVALLLAGSPLALAQTSPAPPSQPQTKSQTQSQSKPVTIRSIQVVDVEELNADVRSKVDAFIANTKQEEIKSLRDSIDATPEAVSALKAKGRNSTQVVAINIDENGVLTMFTKAA
jgi:hypothetical protein